MIRLFISYLGPFFQKSVYYNIDLLIGITFLSKKKSYFLILFYAILCDQKLQISSLSISIMSIVQTKIYNKSAHYLHQKVLIRHKIWCWCCSLNSAKIATLYRMKMSLDLHLICIKIMMHILCKMLSKLYNIKMQYCLVED